MHFMHFDIQKNVWKIHDFCHFLTIFMTIPGLENKNHFPWLFQATGTMHLASIRDWLTTDIVYFHLFHNNLHGRLVVTVIFQILLFKVHAKVVSQTQVFYKMTFSFDWEIFWKILRLAEIDYSTSIVFRTWQRCCWSYNV